MSVLNSSLDIFSCVTTTRIEGILVMSNKYYNITFKLRGDVAAEGKSKEAAA